MDFRRLKNVFLYGWKDAADISKETGRNRIGLFIDMLSCFLKYYVFGYQYKKEKLYNIHGEERKEICLKLQKKNKKQIQWQNEFYDNYKFLNKWSSLKYEQSPDLQKKRWAAYTMRYGFGKNCVIGHDVLLVRHHHLDGTISVGNNVLIAKHTFIDYSGELIIHDNVSIANGVIMETHTHYIEREKGGGATQSRLEIGEGSKILTRAYISDTCHSIGRYARIGAGAYVRSNIPPYAIVMGNPAKIIGFLYSPEEMVEFEKEKYPESERTPLDQYTLWYEKYFGSRLKETKSFIKL
jgi:acetyltransferase-like isoleucine patch superfamily enzyme